MKILHFPAYITINGIKAFLRSTSGYGYMTIDIATSIANLGIDVDLLTQSNITKGLKYKNVNILKRTWWNILSKIRLSDIWMTLKTIITDHVALKKIPNVVLYNISMGYFCHILRKNKYDLIHIHGIGHYTLPIINVCEKNNIKYVVTLHGLNSFSDSIDISKWEKQNEKLFLQKALEKNIPVSVISIGIKQTILNHFKIKDSDNFRVIPNACEVNSKEFPDFFNIREKYNIPETNRIIVCVGNIGLRKNQIQIVRSFSLLPDILKNELRLLLLGRDSTNGLVQNEIDSLGLNSQIKMCGNIPKEEVKDYYHQADFNIVASISEGFGLSIIEGFVYGLPTVTFADLDAVKDVYHPEAMFLVYERTDEAFKNGIVEMLDKKWDKAFIRNYAQKFSFEKMAEKYSDFYKQIINEKND